MVDSRYWAKAKGGGNEDMQFSRHLADAMSSSRGKCAGVARRAVTAGGHCSHQVTNKRRIRAAASLPSSLPTKTPSNSGNSLNALLH